MRHQPLDVALLQIVGGEYFVNHIAQHGDSHFEHFATGHADKSPIAGSRLIALGHTAGAIQQILVMAIGVQMRRQHTRLLGGAQHHCASTIGKQDGRGAISEIGNAGERL